MSVVRSVTRAMSRATAAMGVANQARTDAQQAAATAASMSSTPGAAGKDGKDSTVAGPAGAASTVPGPPGKDSVVPGPIGPVGPAGPAGTIGLINVGEVLLPALALNGTTTIVITWATPFADTNYKLAPWLSVGLALGTNISITNTVKAVDKVTYTVKGLSITVAGTFRVIAYA